MRAFQIIKRLNQSQATYHILLLTFILKLCVYNTFSSSKSKRTKNRKKRKKAFSHTYVLI